MVSDRRRGLESSWAEYLSGTQLTELHRSWPERDIAIPDDASSSHYVQKTLIIPHSPTREVILAAWATVLSLFTASDDIAFGVVIGDTSPSSAGDTKHFPFRLDLSPDDPVETVVHRARESLHQIEGHAIDFLADVSSLFGRGTILQISTMKPENEDVAYEKVGRYGTPINISFQPKANNTTIQIHARQDLYVPQYLDELLRQTSIAVENLMGLPPAPSQEEAYKLILSWTQPCELPTSTLLLHELVEKQSQMTPSAIAIGESERVITYHELNSGADLLAKHLSAKWLDSTQTRNVGVFFEKSVFAIMSMLAILKAGGTYVPLDIAWPQQRIAIVLENANIRDVLCSKTQSSYLPTDKRLRTMMIDERTLLDLQSSSDRQQGSCKIDCSVAAYMLYTSGSTGVPKGISVSHRAICTSIQAMARHLNINTETRTFQYTTFTFDLNIADLWMTLGHGGRICLPTEEERLSPNDFIVQERCNYAMITPTAASMIDSTVMHDNIKTLALIGESVPERLLHKIATPDSSRNLYNTWGPTEACVIASSSESITMKDRSPSLHPNNVGRPIGASIFLVDAADPHKLAAPFAPGEIALVGYSLANGYYGNDKQTADAFRTDLKWTRNELLIARVGGAEAMKTVYLTGDIGRYNSNGDGTMIFMHRKGGGYIKINGYRVDPGEIESRVLELANDDLSLKDVCVLSHEQGEAGPDSESLKQALVCFMAVGGGAATPGAACTGLSPSTERKRAVKQIVKSMRDTMPEYMIPRLFVPIEHLPILTSHKIDRKSMLGILQGISWGELVDRFGI